MDKELKEGVMAFRGEGDIVKGAGYFEHFSTFFV